MPKRSPCFLVSGFPHCWFHPLVILSEAHTESFQYRCQYLTHRRLLSAELKLPSSDRAELSYLTPPPPEPLYSDRLPEFEQAPGDGEAQGSLAYCSPWGRKECTRLSDWTTRLPDWPHNTEGITTQSTIEALHDHTIYPQRNKMQSYLMDKATSGSVYQMPGTVLGMVCMRHLMTHHRESTHRSASKSVC